MGGSVRSKRSKESGGVAASDQAQINKNAESSASSMKRSSPVFHSMFILVPSLLLCLLLLLVWIIALHATTLKNMDDVRPTIETLIPESKDSPVANEDEANRKKYIDQLEDNDKTLHTVSYLFIAIFILVLLQTLQVLQLAFAGPNSSISKHCWNRQFEEIRSMETWKSWNTSSVKNNVEEEVGGEEMQ